jgi:biotin-dependent carboxylase-like uncharacterized protein
MLEILDGGVSTTVQDLGRFGQYHIGMPPAGAMDQYAHKIGNYLVGNDESAATLEMTYGGADVKFHDDAVVALTGATLPATLDGEDVPMNEAVRVEAGQELETTYTTDGARSYLAVAGGIDVPSVMDSRATYTLVGIGGKDGRTLEEGDRLELAGSDGAEQVGKAVPDEYVRDYESTDSIRVVIGLCDYRLTDESREELCDAEWKVTPEADRVGYRLEGPELDFVEREQPFGAGTDLSNVVDLGYPIGSIQLPQKPIVLMRDAVTGGGYATVGTVISTDRDLLAQRRTHQSVYFDAVTVDDALDAREATQSDLAAVRDLLSE